MEKKLAIIFVCAALALSGCSQANSKDDAAEKNQAAQEDANRNPSETDASDNNLPGPDSTDGINGTQTDVSPAQGGSFFGDPRADALQGAVTIDRPTLDVRTAVREESPQSYAEQYDKRDAALAALYHACSASDATLALVMSAFPHFVWQDGIMTENSQEDELDPDELYEAITCCENSGEVKELLLGEVEKRIWNGSSDDVEVKFYLGKGQADVFCPFKIDKMQSSSPINTALAQTRFDVDRHCLMEIKLRYPVSEAIDRTNVGIFDMTAGFYRIADEDQAAPREPKPSGTSPTPSLSKSPS